MIINKKTSQLKKDSKGKADQIRTLDKATLIIPIGRLNGELVKNVDTALKIHLNLNQE